MAGWDVYRDIIQQLHFRSGPYSYLEIKHDQDSGLVVWEFFMQDFGMCHRLKGMAIVGYTQDEGYTVNRVQVQGGQQQEAWAVVFGGRYEKYLNEFYTELGVIPL